MTAATSALGGPERGGFFDALAPGGKRALFLLALAAVLFIFIFPVFWLMLTSLKPGWEVFYVHRGTELFSVYAYIEAFQNLNFGRGSAAAVIGGLASLVGGMIVYRVLARVLEVSR